MTRVVAVGHVGLNARDLTTLATFYRETLGLRQVAYHDGVVAIFAVGDTQTDLFLMPGERGPVEFDLITDDVDGLRAKLVAAGVACTEATDSKVTGHRSFKFTDPEGNEVAVTSAHRRR